MLLSTLSVCMEKQTNIEMVGLGSLYEGGWKVSRASKMYQSSLPKSAAFPSRVWTYRSSTDDIEGISPFTFSDNIVTGMVEILHKHKIWQHNNNVMQCLYIAFHNV